MRSFGSRGGPPSSAGAPPTWEDPYASPAVPRLQAKRESDARVTKPALIITHLPDRKSGLVREAIEYSGYPIREQNVFDGTPLPPIDRVGAIVSLGGKMSATRVDEDEYLTAEVSLLQAAVANGVPTLGICLGAQLLAVAAGGDVVTMPRVYVGWPQLSRTAAADDDRVFGDLSSGTHVLKWHEDRIEPPPERRRAGDDSQSRGGAVPRRAGRLGQPDAHRGHARDAAANVARGSRRGRGDRVGRPPDCRLPAGERGPAPGPDGRAPSGAGAVCEPSLPRRR